MHSVQKVYRFAKPHLDSRCLTSIFFVLVCARIQYIVFGRFVNRSNRLSSNQKDWAQIQEPRCFSESARWPCHLSLCYLPICLQMQQQPQVPQELVWVALERESCLPCHYTMTRYVLPRDTGSCNCNNRFLN